MATDEMEKRGPNLRVSTDLPSHETIRNREACKYTPRSAGSVQRPQRSKELLNLVRFLTDHDAPFPEDDFMGPGSEQNASECWTSKELPKAKKWKSQEELAHEKGQQKIGIRWRRDKSTANVSISDPEERRPPPIAKDPKVPELLLPSTRSKGTTGHVKECLYPGVGILPSATGFSDDMPKSLGSLTSMWTPPTLEMPLTPSSSEFSPMSEGRERKYSKNGSSVSSHGSRSCSPTEPKQDEKINKPDDTMPQVSKISETPKSQQENSMITNKVDGSGNELEMTRKFWELPANNSGQQKRGGVCVDTLEQTQALVQVAPLSQAQSTHIDLQYLPRRTSSKRGSSRGQGGSHPLLQPLSHDHLFSSFQKSIEPTTSTSCLSEPDVASPLIRIPTRRHPVRRPAPLLLSPNFQNEGYIETLPPTPSSCSMPQSQISEPPLNMNPPKKSLPPTPTEPSSQVKSADQKMNKAPSKLSSLWPPRLNLRPSREKFSKAEIMSPWRGNAFAQLSNMPSPPTVPLDPSAQVHEERRAGEVPSEFTPRASEMNQPNKITSPILENRLQEDIVAIKYNDISPKSSSKDLVGPMVATTGAKLPESRKGPGEPPKIPLPADPPKCESRTTSPINRHPKKPDSGTASPRTVPNTPIVEDKSFDGLPSPKTYHPVTARNSAVVTQQDARSSTYSRQSKNNIQRVSWGTAELGLTSRPVTPSLPSSDDEKGVLAYCGSTSRSGKSRRRSRNRTPSNDIYLTSPISRKRDKESHPYDSGFPSRPSTRDSIDQRKGFSGTPSPRLSGSSRNDAFLIQQLQERIISLERQNKMLHAALSAAINMGGKCDMDFSRNTSFAQADSSAASISEMLSGHMSSADASVIGASNMDNGGHIN